MLFPYRQNLGFTLIEILIVVVIVSIMTVVGVQMISSGSVERTVQQKINSFIASFEYSCDQASLQNIIYGVKFIKTGYAFAKYINQEWIDISANDYLPFTQYKDGLFFELEVDARSVLLNEDVPDIPQVICDSNGEMSQFKLSTLNLSNTSIYQLQVKDFWTLEGQWLNEK